MLSHQVQRATLAPTRTPSQVVVTSYNSRTATASFRFNEASHIPVKRERLRETVIAAAERITTGQTPVDAAARRFENETHVILTNIMTFYRRY